MSDSHSFGDDQAPFEDIQASEQIESMIRAASGYVRPSEDLRPRTLEAARRHCDDRRAEKKFGGFVIAVILLVSISTPAIQFVHLRRAQTTAPTASEIQDRAIEYAAEPGIGPHWGLAEAFTQLRRVQANRLGQSFRTIK